MFLACFFHSLTFLCVVEPEDKAVATLVTHFTQVITDVVGNNWSHLPTEWLSKEKQKIFVISSSDFEKSRILDPDPQPFFLGHHRLAQKLYDIRMKVVQSLRSFNFSHYTPLIQEIFHDLDFGIENSGINVLFTPPKRGRPSKAAIKKRKRQEMDMEYLPANSFSKRRSRRRGGPKRIKTGKGPVVDHSSSDSNKVLNIADILLQARDIRTRKWKVFVEWDDRSLAEASWTPLTNLPKDSALWWYLLRESRYPMFTEDMFPSLPISGPLPNDEQVTESTASDDEQFVSSSSDSD